MSKMRLKPATIGVVRSCAIPHAVKQQMSAINSTTMPLPISGWLRVCSEGATATPLAMLLNGSRSSRGRPHLSRLTSTHHSAIHATQRRYRGQNGAREVGQLWDAPRDQRIVPAGAATAADGGRWTSS